MTTIKGKQKVNFELIKPFFYTHTKDEKLICNHIIVYHREREYLIWIRDTDIAHQMSFMI